jgi:hypothetical protein
MRIGRRYQIAPTNEIPISANMIISNVFCLHIAPPIDPSLRHMIPQRAHPMKMKRRMKQTA